MRWLFASTLCFALAQLSSASVIGIDFGSNFMKVALVQLKVPLEIVPNTISKRKTEIAVAFDRGERMYGSDAAGMLTRKPGMAYAHFREMIGRNEGHPSVEDVAHMKYGTSPYQNETRGGLDYRYKGDQNIVSFSSEELAAMIFTYARDITKDFGGQSVRDCVITVPSFATAIERRGIINAAEIAGLKVLSLIEENTAAALQLGKDSVEEDKVVLYYNMGATSTQVMIARYSNYTVKEAGKNKTIGTFEVLSKSWDETLGGEGFDRIIMETMADEFTSKNKESDVRSSHKAMGKLRAQATKTKHVLSANTEIPVKINSLMDDKDYTTHMTRKGLEKLAQPLIKRLTPPIQRALDFANLTLEDIDAVEMIGGAQRIPAVQKRLSEFFGQSLPLGVHLNADEAPALGAAFEAANISTMFKVRKTGMVDHSPWPVSVSLKSIPKVDDVGLLGGLFTSKKTEDEIKADEESDAWSKSTTLFKPWSKLDSRKLISFHHDRDITCEVSYEANDNSLPQGSAKIISQVNITGISEFVKGMETKGLKTCGNDENTKPKVTLHFKLDASGIVRLLKGEATCEQPEAVAVDTASEEESADKTATTEEEKTASEDETAAASEGDEKKTKGDEDKKTEGSDETSKEEEVSEEETAEQKKARKQAKKEAKKKEAEKAKKDKKKKEKKDQPYKLELGVVEQFTAPELKCLHPDLVQESKDKLAYLQELDNERRYKLEAKNSLESYLYEVKNRVEDEAQVIDQISTEEQQEVLFEKVRYYIDWIDEDGYDEKGDVYKAKQLEVSELAEPLFFRAKELTARPEAIEMAQKRLRDIRLLVDKWVDTMPQVTESERADVIALVEKAETWLEDKMALQAATESHETPAFTSTEVSQSLKATANLVTRLSRKPKPKPKPVVNITNATNSTSSNRSNTTNVEEEEHEDDVVEEVETLKTDGKGEEDGSSNKDDSVGPDDEL